MFINRLLITLFNRCDVLVVALKIHISSECKKYLDDLGGWMIERRGIIDIKVSLV